MTAHHLTFRADHAAGATRHGTVRLDAAPRAARRAKRSLQSGVCRAALALTGLGALGTQPALAGCESFSHVVVFSCDASSVNVSIAAGGSGFVTVDGLDTVSVIYASPQVPGVYDQTLTLTGTTSIDNPNYSGVVMQFGTTSDTPPQPIAVTVNATVEIGEDVTANSGPGGFGTIWVLNDYAGTIDIDNAGTLKGTFTDSSTATLSGVTNLGAVTITNSGSVTSTGGRGIYADGNHDGTDAATVSVTNTATGSVSATTAGIRVIAYNGLASITNEGSVSSTLFQGLVAWSAEGNATVTNRGSVTSNTDNAVYAATKNGTATVTNSGTVTATGYLSYDAARAQILEPVGYNGLIATASQLGDVFITNEAGGIVSAERQAAIRAATPEGWVTIVNAGSLFGDVGIFADSGLSDDLTSATDATVDGRISVVNSGTIQATGLAVWLDATTNHMVNTGTITVGGFLGVVAGNGDTTIENQGTITTAANGIAISMGSGVNRLVLHDTSSINGLVTNVSSDNTLELTGTASGALDVATVAASGRFRGFSTLVKSGSGTWTITGSGSSLTDGLVVDEGTLALDGELSVVKATVGSDVAATLAISGGGSLTSVNATVGTYDGGEGTVTISGTGASWTSTGNLVVGHDGGTGSITVSDGAAFAASRLALSTGNWQAGEGGSGSLTVTGDGTSWTNTGGVDVARTAGSTGSLTISDGAQASIVKTGIYAGAGAEILITGEGTSVVVGSKTVETDRAWLSPDGGSVTVSDKAYLFANGIYVGAGGGDLATMTITGAGTIVEADVRLYVGGQNGSRDVDPVNGNGVLVVSEGAQVTVAGTVGAGMDPNSKGIITVAGDGSLLWAKANPAENAVGNFYVGYNGSPTVVVAEGGVIRADNEVRIGYAAQGSGVLAIGAADGEAAAAAGIVDSDTIAFGAGAGSLVFNHTGEDYELAAALTGDGTILHRAGVTRLTGDGSAFTGDTTITGGLVFVDEVLGGADSIVAVGDPGGSGAVDHTDPAAVLSGIGTVFGTVTIHSGGGIAGGSSDPSGVFGTLTIDGDLVLTNGATLGVNVAPLAGTATLVHVTGSAVLAGSVYHFGSDGLYDPGARYTILTADQGYTGAFDGVVTNFAFLDAFLDYEDDDVLLSLTRNDVDVADVAATPNQAAAAGGIESLGTESEILRRMLMLGEDEARDALDSLSGEAAASVRSSLFLSSQHVSRVAQSRLARAFGQGGGATGSIVSTSHGKSAGGLPALGGVTVWTQAIGSTGDIDGSGNAAGLGYDTAGIAFGADAALDGTSRLGLLVAYHASDLSVADRSSSAKATTIEVGLYGGTEIGGFGLKGGAGYSWHDLDTARSAAIGGFSETLEGATKGGAVQLFGEIGYRFDVPGPRGGFELEPFLGVDYVHLNVDGYTESGGTMALTVSEATSDVAYSTLGLRVAHGLAFGATDARVTGLLGWRHGFGDLVPTSTNAFAGGADFEVEGAPLEEDVAVIGAGLSIDLAPDATLTLDYQGQFGGSSQLNTGSARFSLRF